MGVDEESIRLVRSAVGQRVERFHRIFYTTAHGEVLTDDGTAELIFDSGLILYFQDVEGGDRLVVKEVPWESPYDPLTFELFESMKEVGEPRRFDVSNREPYDSVIGCRLVQVTEGYNDFARKLCAFELTFENDASCTMVASADEMHLHWEPDYLHQQEWIEVRD